MMALTRAALSASCALGRTYCRSVIVGTTKNVQLRSKTQLLRSTILSTANTCKYYSTERENSQLDRLVENAQLMLKIEKYEKAKSLYDTIIEQYPGDVRGYGGRADAYYFMKQYENAIADFKQVIRYQPACVPALQNIAMCHAKLNQHNEAIKDLSYLLSIDAKYMPAYGTRADIYEEMGEVEKAADDYMKIISYDPSNVDALVGLGKLAMKRKDLEDAREIYTRVVRLDYTTPSVASRLGNLEYASNVRDGKPYNSVHPHIEAYRSLAVIAYTEGDWKNVIPMLDHAKDLELENDTYKEDSTSLLMRGATYFNTGDPIKAFGFLDKAAKMDPKNAMAFFLRGAVHFTHQSYEKSLSDYKNYLNILTNEQGAADELTVEQIQLVLERIMRVGRLHFQRTNGQLTRVVAKAKLMPKSKIPLQEDSETDDPFDPVQEMFVKGPVDENKDRLVATKGLGKWDEGEEIQFDEALEHKGVLDPSVRAETKSRQVKEVGELHEFVKSGKADSFKAVEGLRDAINAAQQLQQTGIEGLPLLVQDSILKNTDQLLECGKLLAKK